MPVKVKRFSARRMARIKDLVETIPKELVREKLRYDVLNELARRHGIDYETLKRDLYILAYAFFPKKVGTSEKQVPIVEVPKNLRADVKTLREFARKGSIDPEKARKAAQAFLEHAPWVDVERITREHGIKDEEIIQRAREISKWLERVYTTRMYGWKVHPAKAYAFAWNLMGRKIHQELENARELVEKLYPIAGKIAGGKKLTKREKEFLRKLKITETEVLAHINPEESLTENLKSMYLRVLDHNVNYAKAMHWYENAKAMHINLYREVRDKLDQLGRAPPAPPGSIRSSRVFKLGDKIENAYKNIARWPHSPKVKPRDFPRYFKELVREVYESHYNPRTYSFENLPPGFEGEVTKRLAIIGHYIHQGNKVYSRVKEAERNNPILAWIVKRNRKR